MTNYMRDVWPRVVARRYDNGGHMIAQVEMTIEMDDELCHIPKGHHLTRSQAMCYPGAVVHVFRQGESGGEGIPDSSLRSE